MATSSELSAAAAVDAAAVVRELRAVLGPARVRDDEGARTVYGIDATPLFRGRPDCIVFPESTEEVSAVLTVASRHGVPVVPRGGGTNLSAATVPERGGIMLSLTRMNRLLEVDREKLVIVTQPGVTVATIHAAAAEHGLLYPPDPGSRTTATIGGNVATCAGGLRGLRYGVTRDYILGVEAVLADGRVVRCGGPLVKDVAGYDLVRLLCGSEGTLAVLTELTLRLVPAPESSGVGLAYFRTLADAGRVVSRVLRSGVLPATLEFLDRLCIRTVEDFACAGPATDAGALLVFGQDGPADIVARDLRLIADACREEGAIDVTIAPDEAAATRVLDARRATLPSLTRLAPLTVLEDATVPRDRIADMVERIEEIAARHGVLIGTFGHAGDGNLHPTCVLDPDDGDALERMHRAFEEIFRVALELGGTLTGEHGVGLAKLPYLEARLGADQMELLRRIKHAFDPQGLLNPGKLGS